ncbi:MAG: lipopolysaccharide heptosyltransferase II [Gemmatimonadetes bacterium]|nr:MAG: lipopolysaccharide heptosyltransferase II [Gemmatimonadota bacterium]
MNIAIRLPNWIGDAVMATATLSTLRESFPAAEIIGVMKPNLVALFEAHPALDRIVPLEGVFQTAVRLRRLNVDWGLILPNAFSAAWLFFLAGIPRRVGYATEGRRLLLTDPLRYPADFRDHHNVENYLKIAAVAGAKIHVKRLFMPVDEERGRRLIPRHHPERPLVALNPGATFGPAKRWLPDRFAAVGDHLVEHFGAEVVILGGPGDVGTEQQIIDQMRQPAIRLSGKISLADLPSVIAQCTVFISNDTGPMHLAAAVRVPTLALFASTNPNWTAPYGDHHRVIYPKLVCSPCYQRECPLKSEPYACLRAISVEDVLQHVKTMLP